MISCPYRFSVKKIISKSDGRSVVNSAAYISREKLKDNEIGKTFNYKKGHSKKLFDDILLPEYAPEWMRDKEKLWNEVTRVENRKNSQLARPIELNLPHELLIDESVKLMVDVLKNYVIENFTTTGMIAHVVLHEPDTYTGSDERNYHAHILLTLRGVNENGFCGNKVREWNKKELLQQWRENWALECSRMLRHIGLELEANRWEYGHLTLKEQYKKAIEREDFEYAEQACNHEPTKHKGVQIHQMEKRGGNSYVLQDREDELQAAINRNAQLLKLEMEYQALILEKEELEMELSTPKKELSDDERINQKLAEIMRKRREYNELERERER